jgi:putative SOS response-associated peptidase YedK
VLPVIIEPTADERALVGMQWGLVPQWQRKDGKAPLKPINARSETIFEKPLFRPLTKAKRCIVPASGFYEWRTVEGRKQPYYLTSDDGEAWGPAGLYDDTHDEDNDAAGSFTILTTSANPLVDFVHNRMPVILLRLSGPLGDGGPFWRDQSQIPDVSIPNRRTPNRSRADVEISRQLLPESDRFWAHLP